jgi:hypothetical protein
MLVFVFFWDFLFYNAKENTYAYIFYATTVNIPMGLPQVTHMGIKIFMMQ